MKPKAGAKGLRKGEEGVVLLMVVLLVVMFSGLGLLAMRYTRGELRSASAFLDSAQASEAAQAAIFMVATDMRRNWRYLKADTASCDTYYQQFQQKILDDMGSDSDTDSDTDSDSDSDSATVREFSLGFSESFDPLGVTCSDTARGKVPFESLRGAAPLADISAETGGPLLSGGFADVTLRQTQPVVAPPPPGFSNDDEARTYEWYYFSVRSVARYGPEDSDAANPLEATYPKIVRGFAQVRADMKIGPIDAIRSN